MAADREKFLAASGEDKEMLAKVFDKAYLGEKRGIAVFTHFLSEREYAAVLLRERHMPKVKMTAWGGYGEAGRVMLRFSDEEEPFPIKAIKISGRGAEKLKHPDILGSLMKLGFERECIGDIVRGENFWVLFCHDNMSGFIADNFVSAGGVALQCEIRDTEEISVKPEFEEITGTVASLRADSVVSVMLKTSRSKAAEHIEGQRFFLNQALCAKCDKEIKEGDVLNVRHYGKAKLLRISGTSKKGRIFITIQKYI